MTASLAWRIGLDLCCLLSLAAIGRGEEPARVTVCQIKVDPAAYNHKLVAVTAFVSHGFEDFTLFDPSCPSWPGVWLEYGGTESSGTVYCCGPTDDRSRPEPAVVDNIPIPLVDDERFREFDRLIQRPPDTVVHATIVGRFFAGRVERFPNGAWPAGYGHMGCCSLLAIQRVISVDPQDRADLDYRASPDQPNIRKVGCGFRYLLPLESAAGSMAAQREADGGQTEWAFTDPQRVATPLVSK